MPCVREEWPISECLGVLFGVLGIDWLMDGKASIWIALASALIAGITISVWRKCRRRNERDEP